MTLGEFSTAIKKDKAAIITVKKHKTAHILTACLTIRKELMREVEVFMDFIRTKLDGIGTNSADTVFSSWGDGKMDSSVISQLFDSFWKSALGKAERVNPTIIRKMTSTHSKRMNSDVICHSVKTAEEHYFLNNKQNQVVETLKVVRELQRANYNKTNQTNVFNIDNLCQIFGDEIKTGRITTDCVKRK